MSVDLYLTLDRRDTRVTSIFHSRNISAQWYFTMWLKETVQETAPLPPAEPRATGADPQLPGVKATTRS